MTTSIQGSQSLQSAPLKTVCSPERTPHKSTSPDQPHISASQLRSYSGCPLAWRLARTHRPEHISASLVFGSAFHAAAEKLFQMRLEGKTATHPELMEAYERIWLERETPTDGKQPLPVKFSEKADPSILRQTAGKMLETFREHAEENMGEVIAVEEEFLIEMAPGLPALKGRIDLIEIRRDLSGEKRLHVVDFKTSAKRMKLEDVDRGQLDLYAIAIRRTGLLEQPRLPLVLRVDVVTKTKAPEVTPMELTPNRYNESRVVAKAREIWKCMSAGVCYPNPGWQCSGCGFKTLCNKWPNIPDFDEENNTSTKASLHSPLSAF